MAVIPLTARARGGKFGAGVARRGHSAHVERGSSLVRAPAPSRRLLFYHTTLSPTRRITATCWVIHNLLIRPPCRYTLLHGGQSEKSPLAPSIIGIADKDLSVLSGDREPGVVRNLPDTALLQLRYS